MQGYNIRLVHLLELVRIRIMGREEVAMEGETDIDQDSVNNSHIVHSYNGKSGSGS